MLNNVLVAFIFIGVLIIIFNILFIVSRIRLIQLKSIGVELSKESKKPVENNKYKYTRSFLRPYLNMDNILQQVSSIDLFGIFTYDDFKEVLATNIRKSLYARITFDGKCAWMKEEFDETDIMYLQILDFINTGDANIEIGRIYDRKINDRMQDIVKEEINTSQKNAKIGDVLDDNFVPEDLGIARPKNEDENLITIEKNFVSPDDLSEDYEDF